MVSLMNPDATRQWGRMAKCLPLVFAATLAGVLWLSPTFAIMWVLLGAGVVMFLRPSWAVAGVSFLIPIQLYFSGAVPGVTEVYSLAIVSGHALFIVALLITLRRGTGTLKGGLMAVPILVFLFATVASSINAPSPQAAMGNLWVSILGIVALYYALVTLLDTTSRIQTAVKYSALGAGALAVLGVVLWVLGPSATASFLQSRAGVLLNGLHDVHRQFIFGLSAIPSAMFRHSAPGYNAGYFSAFLGIPFGLAVAMFCANKAGLQKMFWGVILGAIVFGIIFSLTRGSWLALGISSSVLFIIGGAKGVVRLRRLCWVLAVWCILAAAVLFLPDLMPARFAKRIYHVWETGSVQSRLLVWTDYIKVIPQYILLGRGQWIAYSLGSPHNSFLLNAYISGALGGLAFIAVFVVALFACWRVYTFSNDPTLRAIAFGLIGGLIYVMVTEQFVASLWRDRNRMVLWFGLAVCAALYRVAFANDMHIKHVAGGDVASCRLPRLAITAGSLLLALTLGAAIMHLSPFQSLAVFEGLCLLVLGLPDAIALQTSYPRGKRRLSSPRYRTGSPVWRTQNE